MNSSDNQAVIETTIGPITVRRGAGDHLTADVPGFGLPLRITAPVSPDQCQVPTGLDPMLNTIQRYTVPPKPKYADLVRTTAEDRAALLNEILRKDPA